MRYRLDLGLCNGSVLADTLPPNPNRSAQTGREKRWKLLFPSFESSRLEVRECGDKEIFIQFWIWRDREPSWIVLVKYSHVHILRGGTCFVSTARHTWWHRWIFEPGYFSCYSSWQQEKQAKAKSLKFCLCSLISLCHLCHRALQKATSHTGILIISSMIMEDI